ncbi:RdgB/HAM1 family non-canonical purine NTP pyrophosphatase [Pedobacter heparinus]|uniref:dITP/XTP pyrophosphatase n=1 Tax=Pedobacter heparinus (strain ATCC 13125 / DSM 2366 / CIP 104194 / JCM 7457 / NBRC 12017 / NCIMB 9290 / NRRL B-14731 / HIM 762-3) TaxID=485917 RepID=C6Y021_PEDHD|nr:RdgB/HAM1 family non-canonical purine NTP pyrophosphatase [Pedobacter heparinus]ACU02716.1 non-canonical purine NTP pyrophosphatase, rdgB/HAM1 family [Pedobacter heparinus DSM 2366]
MKELVFATNNEHKTLEVRELLSGRYKVLNLRDIGCTTDIPETGNSFAENAALKSQYVIDHYKIDCFADDSGLEIEALNQEPGIFSARYSGKKDDRENLKLVLQKMEGQENRKARFRTVISLVRNNEHFLFEGIIYGNIRETPSGDQGFGYDPIFEPLGYTQTFAEMSMVQKNEISHRALAMSKLITFLKEQA